ncbi:MAG: hypothetical protein JWR10_3055, partial [Rubritepida sp.]|nr:hypothetical protein [Rubritepida sp.]
MIRPWLRAAATAVQFLTRLPIPGGASAAPELFARDIGRSLLFFPLVGAAIGTLAALALYLADLAWPLALAVLIALALEARLTGALHEDALADLCDGLGGGRTPEDVLRILKDSRIGAFGALGLMLGLALRAGGLMAQPDAAHAALVLIVSGCIGRLLLLAVMAAVPPVPGRSGLAGSVAPSADWRSVGMAALLASPILTWGVVADPRAMAVAFLGCAAFLIWYRTLLQRRIGGSTGDAIGAAGYAGIVLTTLAFALNR